MDETVEREILGYLLDHPDAEDSVEAIAEWWVLERCIERRVSEVGGALADLLEHDFVTVRRDPLDRLRYRLNAERLDDIRDYLRGAGEPADREEEAP